MTINRFLRDSHTASSVFNQTAEALSINQPRLPFEYYININLNTSDTSANYIKSFFNNGINVVSPLVKSVDMPSMKIETTPLNQYNRKRLSQTKIAYEPIKMVFHDVCDGKTLKFWEMYYRYYFSDGNEPGKNQKKSPLPSGISNANLAASMPSATNTNGNKSTIQNIVADTLDNHNFGFNLDTVQNTRNLIQSIEIYQVHGGLFNQVTLVNPRISAFTHDSLNYATSDKTLEITFSFDYEYAYYTIQNMKLGDVAPNNDSSLDFFSKGDFKDITSLTFTQGTTARNNLYQSTNPSVSEYQGNLYNSVNNVQASLPNVSSQYTYGSSSIASTSSISGLVNISPAPSIQPLSTIVESRSFTSTASTFNSSTMSSSIMYQDVNRTGGNTTTQNSYFINNDTINPVDD